MSVRLRRLARRLVLLGPRSLATSGWALVQLRRVRGALAAGSLASVVVSVPPRVLPGRARRAAVVALRLGRATCLQRSLILQAWDRAHGRDRAVVIGVTAPGDGFRAHAWLDGDHGCDGGHGFHELLRIQV